MSGIYDLLLIDRAPTPATGTKAVYQQLIWTLPPIAEGHQQQRQREQELVDKLGRIRLEVYTAVHKERTILKGLVTEEDEFIAAFQGEEGPIMKKGAFVSTVTVAEEKEVVDDVSYVSDFNVGTHLETLEVRFWHEAQLLMLGADVRHFRKRQVAASDLEMIDLTGDEEEATAAASAHAARRKRKRVRRLAHEDEEEDEWDLKSS